MSPQPEDHWGNLNPAGTGIARIFNTYGPRMRPDDGRVVPRPEVSWRDGLAETLAWFAARLEASAGVRA